ncbi:MAG: glycosyltransferase, partial [Actinobacteria bacterium]|nr:glycosyltransferase [Actinomycetota bacterium]
MTRALRVLRVYHSGVVTDWRERERSLRRRGVQLSLVSPHRWNEGGHTVHLDADGDDFVVPIRTVGRHPFLFLYDPRPLRRLLRSGDFDILDVHEEPASLAAAELQLLRHLYCRPVPLLLYSAQNIHKRYPVPFRWLERRALAHAAAVYVPNTDAGRVLQRKGFKGIVRFLGLGVDVERFSGTERPRSAGALRIGYVGRLEEHKGVHVALEAVASEPRMTLEIVGDGPYRPTLEARSRALGLTDRARFSGFVAHGSLAETYGRFDVVVIPSIPTRTWIEQFCRVAVEAMA